MTRPIPSEPRPFRFPPFTRTRLDNGFTVIACDTPGRPLVTARLVTEAGGFNDETPGTALLTARASTEGTSSLPGTALGEAIESLGADVNVQATWADITYVLRVPVSRAEPALELLAEVVRAPAFPDDEVLRLRGERVNEIKQQDAQPMPRALRGLLETIYTPESPYHRRLGGSTDTVPRITTEVIRRHHRTFVTPGSATLVVTGDLAGLEVPKIAEKLFGDWRAPEPQRAQPQNVDRVNETTVTVIDRPGSVQSMLVAGHHGIARGEPDELPLDLPNHALGGSFNSRINQRLREEKGYTYGARSGIDAGRLAGPILAYAPVETGVTVEALQDLLGVIQGVHEQGITADELDEARRSMSGTFALRFETPEAIASGIAELVVYGLPDDYFDTYGPSLEAVTLDAVNASARARLRPNATAIVVAGDAATVAGPLERFGPVSVVADA